MKSIKMKKALLALIVAVMIVSLFAACSNNANNNTAEKPAVTNTPTDNEPDVDAEPVKLDPITFTVDTADDKLNWDNPISKALTEKTGVSFDYKVRLQEELIDLWLASGDYPDVVAFGPKEIQKYAEGGALVPLNDLIDQYGSNIKEKFGPYYELLKDADGQIWSLYGVNRSEEPSANAMGNFVIQLEVLKDAGYPEIKTLDQLHAIIKAYKEKYPTIDGKETIGYTGAMNGWVLNIQYNNPIISASGLPDHGNYRVLDDGSVQFNPASEDAKSYYAFLNALYRDNLYDKEAFTQDRLDTKMAQGRVLAGYAPNWLLGNVETLLRSEGKPERAYAHLPIFVNDSIEDNSNNTVPTFAGSNQWAITKNAKNPERFIQMLDYIFSDEGQILTQWGIEGDHFTVVDGKRTVTPAQLERETSDPDSDYKQGFKSIATGGEMFWFGHGNGAKLADGDYATPLSKEYVVSTYDATTKEVLAGYGKETWSDFLQPVEFVPGYVWQLTPPEEVTIQAAKLDEAWRKGLPKLVMAKSEADFNKEWDAMKSDMEKAGLEKVNAAYTTLWTDFNNSYIKKTGK